MAMKDVLLIDLHDGADAVLQGEEIALTQGLETAIYMSLFGGNEWWANGILPFEAKHVCQTEVTFRSVALNSSGRLAIERAIKSDLAPLAQAEGLTLGVSVSIVADKANINIQLGGVQYEYTYSPSGDFLLHNTINL